MVASVFSLMHADVPHFMSLWHCFLPSLGSFFRLAFLDLQLPFVIFPRLISQANYNLWSTLTWQGGSAHSSCSGFLILIHPDCLLFLPGHLYIFGLALLLASICGLSPWHATLLPSVLIHNFSFISNIFHHLQSFPCEIPLSYFILFFYFLQ